MMPILNKFFLCSFYWNLGRLKMRKSPFIVPFLSIFKRRKTNVEHWRLFSQVFNLQLSFCFHLRVLLISFRLKSAKGRYLKLLLNTSGVMTQSSVTKIFCAEEAVKISSFSRDKIVKSIHFASGALQLHL